MITSSKKTILPVLVFGMAVFLFWLFQRQNTPSISTEPVVTNIVTATMETNIVVNELKTNTNRPARRQSPLRRRFVDFSDAEKAKFLADYTNRYTPVISKWCKVYEGRLPFSPEEVTLDNFVERFSADPSAFAEYIFVVNGVTLGLRDVNGTPQVDYLNDPQQTKKMATLPKNEVPITTLPLTREDLSKLLEADSGTRFQPYELRMKPSGFSGALNGGAIVHVGGNPENFVSWKYDMVFGADGKLAFYLRGRK